MTNYSDEQLWNFVRRKDHAAIEQLYRRYYSSLLHYALSFRFDEEYAKDCVHDLFIKLFNKELLPEIRQVKPYLYRAYKNLLIDGKRNQSENIPLEDELFADFLIEDHELQRLFEHSDEDLTRSRRLINAYNKLSANQRNALYLYYIKEFSWDELADTLEITAHSAMNLIGRSVNRIRKLVEIK